MPSLHSWVYRFMRHESWFYKILFTHFQFLLLHVCLIISYTLTVFSFLVCLGFCLLWENFFWGGLYKISEFCNCCNSIFLSTYIYIYILLNSTCSYQVMKLFMVVLASPLLLDSVLFSLEKGWLPFYACWLTTFHQSSQVSLDLFCRKKSCMKLKSH